MIKHTEKSTCNCLEVFSVMVVGFADGKRAMHSFSFRYGALSSVYGIAEAVAPMVTTLRFPAPKVVGIPVISTANMLRSGALWLKDLLKYESQANTSYQMV